MEQNILSLNTWYENVVISIASVVNEISRHKIHEWKNSVATFMNQNSRRCICLQDTASQTFSFITQNGLSASPFYPMQVKH
jgi:hypothetical protein